MVGWILAIVGMIGRFRQRLIDQTIRDDSAFAFTFHKIVPDRSITFEEARAALRNRTSTRERERGFALLSASHHRSCLLQSRDCGMNTLEHVAVNPDHELRYVETTIENRSLITEINLFLFLVKYS